MVHHLCQLSDQSMGTAAESDHAAVTVSHSAQQCGDLLLADGRVDEVAELDKLVPGKSSLLPVINQPEGVNNWSQGALVELQVPTQQDLQNTQGGNHHSIPSPARDVTCSAEEKLHGGSTSH